MQRKKSRGRRNRASKASESTTTTSSVAETILRVCSAVLGGVVAVTNKIETEQANARLTAEQQQNPGDPAASAVIVQVRETSRRNDALASRLLRYAFPSLNLGEEAEEQE